MKHILPPLPYYHASLEPHIDAHTMTLHHDKHHASYVANLNAALENFPELHERSALWLLLNLDKVPQTIRSVVRNNAGGHENHSLFWRSMSPVASNLPAGKPAGDLAEAIDRDFSETTIASASVTGSAGTPKVWTVRTPWPASIPAISEPPV